jgi:FkbM family methyltransferase
VPGAPRLLGLRALRRLGVLERVELTTHVRHFGRRIAVPVIGGFGIEHRMMPASELLPALAASLALRPGTFIDVGAHLGQTLIKLLALGDGQPYLGFEPKVGAAAYVQRLLRANPAQRGSVVVSALGEAPGVAELLLSGELDDSASVVKGFRPEGFYRERRIVPVLRGDDAVEQAGAAPVGVLKVDAEGAELEVLRGFETTLARDRPIVPCEILPMYDERSELGRFRRPRADAVLQLLFAQGYRCFGIGGDGGVAEIDRLLTVSATDYVFVPDEDAERFRAEVERYVTALPAPGNG